MKDEDARRFIFTDDLDVTLDVGNGLAITIDHRTRDRYGRWLDAHARYLDGNMSFEEYNEEYNSTNPYRPLTVTPTVSAAPPPPIPVTVIVPLRLDDEPEAPANFPKAIVHRWSGKR